MSMSTRRRSAIVLLCAALGASVLVLTSCGGGSTSSSTNIARVVVIPTISSVEVNHQQAFTANALDKDGNTVNGVTFTWASSASDVAAIDSSTGVATGKSGGTTQITATASSQDVTSSPATLAVLPDVASVTIAPISATIKAGERQQFVATAKDVKGNTVNGAVFNWAISFSGVATIDKNGLATGVSAGTALVTATAGSATSPVTTLNITNR